MFVQTPRLALRRFTQADLDNLCHLDADPEVMRFIGPPISSREVAETKFLPRLVDSYSRLGFGCWATDSRADGSFVGWFQLRPVMVSAEPMVMWRDAGVNSGSDVESAGLDHDRLEASDLVAELGYRLRRSAWGQGFATEGASALVRYAFHTVGVAEVVATTMAANLASRRVLEKVGLRYARTTYPQWERPLPGSEQGEVEYHLAADQQRLSR